MIGLVFGLARIESISPGTTLSLTVGVAVIDADGRLSVGLPAIYPGFAAIRLFPGA